MSKLIQGNRLRMDYLRGGYMRLKDLQKCLRVDLVELVLGKGLEIEVYELLVTGECENELAQYRPYCDLDDSEGDIMFKKYGEYYVGAIYNSFNYGLGKMYLV